MRPVPATRHRARRSAPGAAAHATRRDAIGATPE